MFNLRFSLYSNNNKKNPFHMTGGKAGRKNEAFVGAGCVSMLTPFKTQGQWTRVTVYWRTKNNNVLEKKKKNVKDIHKRVLIKPETRIKLCLVFSKRNEDESPRFLQQKRILWSYLDVLSHRNPKRKVKVSQYLK